MPIRRLKSAQWIITLDKLVLVAGPLSDTEVRSGFSVMQLVRVTEVSRKIFNKIVKFYSGCSVHP